jgi:HSP20 family protein
MSEHTPAPLNTNPAPAATAATGPSAAHDEPALRPPVDVIEDANGITLYADLPGVTRDRLRLDIDGDQLSLSGEMLLPLAEGMVPSHAEVRLQRYRRTFTLSKELDAEKVGAELSHGVLRVRIPKAEHLQPRKIAVQVA